MDGGTVRASLIQLVVSDTEPPAERRARAAALVRAQRGSDLVVLPELWALGGFAYDLWSDGAEALDGPTSDAMAAAAKAAGVWLHAGSIVERDPDGPIYNTSLLFAPDGELVHTYRKIHRFGFDSGEAVVMGAGQEIVTAATDVGTLGLATCYDLRFPELFRALLDSRRAGAGGPGGLAAAAGALDAAEPGARGGGAGVRPGLQHGRRRTAGWSRPTTASRWTRGAGCWPRRGPGRRC